MFFFEAPHSTIDLESRLGIVRVVDPSTIASLSRCNLAAVWRKGRMVGTCVFERSHLVSTQPNHG